MENSCLFPVSNCVIIMIFSFAGLMPQNMIFPSLSFPHQSHHRLWEVNSRLGLQKKREPASSLKMVVSHLLLAIKLFKNHWGTDLARASSKVKPKSLKASPSNSPLQKYRTTTITFQFPLAWEPHYSIAHHSTKQEPEATSFTSVVE